MAGDITTQPKQGRQARPMSSLCIILCLWLLHSVSLTMVGEVSWLKCDFSNFLKSDIKYMCDFDCSHSQLGKEKRALNGTISCNVFLIPIQSLQNGPVRIVGNFKSTWNMKIRNVHTHSHQWQMLWNFFKTVSYAFHNKLERLSLASLNSLA